MTAGDARDDDEALRWEGDAPDAAATAPPEESRRAPDPERRSGTLLITYGVLGGVYLVYTVLWILGANLTEGSPDAVLAAAMFQFGEFLAIASCPIWFATVLALTPADRPARRLTWLVAGLVLLVPWPFFLEMAS